ncbi:MAG TPA: hypothetical protein GYA05_05580 [Acholeplasmataceae bacterium]|nr:hypothetical protein [Acholeplasmataceae bacterium]
MEVIVQVDEWLGRFGLSTYTLFIACGLVLMFVYLIRVLEKKNRYSRERTNRILLWILISLAAAYLFAWFFDSLFHYFETGVFEGGMTFISGMLGGVACFSLFTYLFNLEERGNILNLLNIIIPGVILAHAFGRIGCFSVGCCYGKETVSFLGVYFPEGTVAYSEGVRTPVHPTQLYEAFFLFALFFGIRKIPCIREKAFPFYLIIYGVFRGILEMFFRGDDRGLLFGLPPSLVLSVFLILLGGFLLVYEKIRGRKEGI